MKTCWLRYFKDNHENAICFSYAEKVDILNAEWIHYRANGVVPKKIEEKGVGAIKRYVKKYVNCRISKQKDIWKNLDKYLEELKKNINRPVKVKHCSLNLEGRMMGVSPALHIRLELQKPYTTEEPFFYLPWLIENKVELFKSTDCLLKELTIMTYDKYERPGVLINLVKKLNNDLQRTK